MVTEIRIYFEGDSALKPGFDNFLREIKAAAEGRCRFRLIATNATPAADFHTAIKTHPDAANVLLLDSDETIAGDLSVFCEKKRLAGLSSQVFWMAQIMESWFLADPESLKKYYGSGFQENALHGNPNVEHIPKSDVLSRLKAATRGTKRKEYHKTGHAPHLLASIRPDLVTTAAPNCKRLFDALRERLAEQ
ncbi:MAG TPA: DUF4276 family protein [Bryobacteraceae bacterium]|jgi:hypothetical protein